MNYAEILKKALAQDTLENLFKGFLRTIECYSCLACISEKHFDEVAKVLKEKNRLYLVSKDDEDDEETKIVTTEYGDHCYISKEIKRVQGRVCWIKDYDNEDFQVIVTTDNEDFETWLLPIFFEEFYNFCERINILTEKKDEENSTNRKEICHILAVEITKNLDGIVTILKEFENVDDDKTINFLTTLFNAYLSN